MVRRNFGLISPEWQERKERHKSLVGFKVIFADGTVYEHSAGLAILPREFIEQHGSIAKALPIEETSTP